LLTLLEEQLSQASALFSKLLLFAHLGLGLWGALGLLEYLTGLSLIIPLQNSNFPPGTQLIHWILAATSGIGFLLGYLKKWKYTPTLMVVLYACLTTLCFIETFDFMTKESRYTLFVIEVIQYIVISLYLFKSQRMLNHFKK
jgi:hypothetical protein